MFFQKTDKPSNKIAMPTGNRLPVHPKTVLAESAIGSWASITQISLLGTTISLLSNVRTCVENSVTESTIPEMPVFAARTSGTPCSTARSRAAAKCWYGPELIPNQASFVTLSSHPGRAPGATVSSGKIAS